MKNNEQERKTGKKNCFGKERKKERKKEKLRKH